jgi:NAD(P)-dependent dehydrogenase (short-subunit alcohol dehydrogenase family)
MTRVAVVTGAAGGIGRACVAAFMEAGWDVAGIDRVERPEGMPGRWYGRIDLGVRSTTDRLRAFFAEVGQIDALVNNAALQVSKSIADTTDADWAAVMATNAAAPFVAIREALPYLRSTKGAVVNVSSVHALATSAQIAAYASSKGALAALTRAAAVELGAEGIRVNAVLPGAIDTAMLRAGAEDRRTAESDADERLASLARRTPLGRIGRPEEIASVIVFLADAERSSFVTGTTMVVDGGAIARLSIE